ncbi:uncharacterized protein LOC129759882 [Uranotaenia lowii]|uniref:uncharacterized protein LOC129759882 n=1 Tax=Uranotaenia lowii TaxID=190385 RepID=UPI00247928C9|nr:uncharacterized protein LOC129759882 [Uranotaenia lowii]
MASTSWYSQQNGRTQQQDQNLRPRKRRLSSFQQQANEESEMIPVIKLEDDDDEEEEDYVEEVPIPGPSKRRPQPAEKAGESSPVAGDEDAPDEEQRQHRFCRLCLSREQQLNPLFPPNGTPDDTLIKRISGCLTIAISFDADYDSYVCRPCVQEVTRFFLYKEQCLVNDQMLKSKRRKQNPDGTDNDVQLEDGDDAEISDDDDDFEGDPIDSDEFDIRDDEIDSQEGLPGALKQLPPSRARRPHVQDFYHGGYRYTCATIRANGNVNWRCMYKSKLQCRASIQVTPSGLVMKGPNPHNHYAEKRTAPPFPTSGTVIDTLTGQKLVYKINTGNQGSFAKMQLIVNGYLFRFETSSMKKTTYWRCICDGCKAAISFHKGFVSCSTNGQPHNHPTHRNTINLAPEPSVPYSMPPGQVVQRQLPVAPRAQPLIPQQHTQLMSSVNLNLNTKSAKWNVMKHRGYEFGYPRIERNMSRWACFKKSLFNCPAIVFTDQFGRVVRESDWAHNHAPHDDYDSTSVIEGYMQDVKTNEQVYYKLIPGKRGQRFVVYKGYRYSSDRLISDGRVAWKCTKCKVFIMIAGRFSTIEDRGGEHEHPMADEDDLQQLQPGQDQQGDDSHSGQPEGDIDVKNESIDYEELLGKDSIGLDNEDSYPDELIIPEAILDGLE